MALATAAHHIYAAGTEGMQVAPEAPSPLGGAFEASLGVPVLPAAACANQVGVDWVPDTEQPLVPEPLRQLCLGCPGRTGCLQWAVASRSVGYWAGTTTSERQQLVELDDLSIDRADDLQAAARRQAAQQDAQDRAAARHPAGQDSLWWYRRGGCRCQRCRAHNALHRSQERARARRAAPSAAA